MDFNSENQVTLTAQKLLFLICALLYASLASAQPLPPTALTLLAAPAPVAKSNTFTLAWNAIVVPPVVSLAVGSTNITRSTNASLVTERGSLAWTNQMTFFKPVSNYVLQIGTNILATTTNTKATVTIAKNTQPTIELRVRLTDGQVLSYGTFAFPEPTGRAVLFTDVQTSADLATWTNEATHPTFVTLNQSHRSYRANLRLESLDTNLNVRVLKQNTLTLTNR